MNFFVLVQSFVAKIRDELNILDTFFKITIF